jgi:transposase
MRLKDKASNAKEVNMVKDVELYGGLDLHGNNVFCTIMDRSRKIVFEKRFPNDLEEIIPALMPYRKQTSSMAVESTYNWYWLVDGLRKSGFPVKLANPSRMEENIGLKEANDKTDARFIARQLITGSLPEGYIYPEETRGVRDMMRRRMGMVQSKTAQWLSLGGLVARHTGKDMGLRELTDCNIDEVLSSHPHALIMAKTNYRAIEFFKTEIAALEAEILKELPNKADYERLMTIPGIGPVLARTILLETGPIARFKHAGNYASYCRTVKTEHTSNNRKKGDCNGKNGNKYLGWAFVEAANHASRHSPELRKWFDRKYARSGKRVIAVKALANKLAKACYFMIRDGKDFDVNRLVG